MKSYTLITLLLCVLVALLAAPSFGASVERRGTLEARDPLPKKRVSNSNSKHSQASKLLRTEQTLIVNPYRPEHQHHLHRCRLRKYTARGGPRDHGHHSWRCRHALDGLHSQWGYIFGAGFFLLLVCRDDILREGGGAVARLF